MLFPTMTKDAALRNRKRKRPGRLNSSGPLLKKWKNENEESLRSLRYHEIVNVFTAFCDEIVNFFCAGVRKGVKNFRRGDFVAFRDILFGTAGRYGYPINGNNPKDGKKY